MLRSSCGAILCLRKAKPAGNIIILARALTRRGRKIDRENRGCSTLVCLGIKGLQKRYSPRKPRFHRGFRRFIGRYFSKRFYRYKKDIFPFCKVLNSHKWIVKPTGVWKQEIHTSFFMPKIYRKEYRMKKKTDLSKMPFTDSGFVAVPRSSSIRNS